MTSRTAHRTALALAVATALFLVWGIGALGVVGTEGARTDLLFLGVIALGVAGAAVVRLRPGGMARTMLAVAAATMVVAVVAILRGEHEGDGSSVGEILAVTGMYATLFAASAALFRRSATAEA